MFRATSPIAHGFARLQKQRGRLGNERGGPIEIFTPAERAALARLTKEQQSWNPFVRKTAKKEALKPRTAQHAATKRSLPKPRATLEVATLSDFKNVFEAMHAVTARTSMRRSISKQRCATREPRAESTSQRSRSGCTGAAQLECEGAVWGAGLDKLAAAVDRPYQALPRELRRDVEFAVRQEERLRRRRESMSMDR
jgi:hypothetical protein